MLPTNDMNTNSQGCNQQRNWLFPSSIEELIPENHPDRLVNGINDQLS